MADGIKISGKELWFGKALISLEEKRDAKALDTKSYCITKVLLNSSVTLLALPLAICILIEGIARAALRGIVFVFAKLCQICSPKPYACYRSTFEGSFTALGLALRMAFRGLVLSWRWKTAILPAAAPAAPSEGTSPKPGAIPPPSASSSSSSLASAPPSTYIPSSVATTGLSHSRSSSAPPYHDHYAHPQSVAGLSAPTTPVPPSFAASPSLYSDSSIPSSTTAGSSNGAASSVIAYPSAVAQSAPPPPASLVLATPIEPLPLSTASSASSATLHSSASAISPLAQSTIVAIPVAASPDAYVPLPPPLPAVVNSDSQSASGGSDNRSSSDGQTVVNRFPTVGRPAPKGIRRITVPRSLRNIAVPQGENSPVAAAAAVIAGGSASSSSSNSGVVDDTFAPLRALQGGVVSPVVVNPAPPAVVERTIVEKFIAKTTELETCDRISLHEFLGLLSEGQQDQEIKELAEAIQKNPDIAIRPSVREYIKMKSIVIFFKEHLQNHSMTLDQLMKILAGKMDPEITHEEAEQASIFAKEMWNRELDRKEDRELLGISLRMANTILGEASPIITDTSNMIGRLFLMIKKQRQLLSKTQKSPFADMFGTAIKELFVAEMEKKRIEKERPFREDQAILNEITTIAKSSSRDLSGYMSYFLKKAETLHNKHRVLTEAYGAVTTSSGDPQSGINTHCVEALRICIGIIEKTPTSSVYDLEQFIGKDAPYRLALIEAFCGDEQIAGVAKRTRLGMDPTLWVYPLPAHSPRQ